MLSTKNKIRIATALSALVRSALRLRGSTEGVVDVRRGGMKWRLDLNEGIDFSIFLLGAFERRTVRTYRRLIRPGDVVLDVGANIGAHALHFARLVGERGLVFACEPTAFAFSKLLQNLELNPELRCRVVAEQVMLSDRDDSQPEAEIYSSWPLKGVAGLHHGHAGRLRPTTGCGVTTLDSYLEASRVARVDFVKLDVDGFECHVLRGGIRSLSSHKPTILMELVPHLLPEHYSSIDELLQILRAAGYKLFRPSGRPLPMDPDYLLGVVPAGTGTNVLALAK
jgi:FkbM family methyltransferase